MSESGHEYLKTHQISGDAVLIDVDAEAQAVLDSARGEATGRAARTLVKEGPLRVVLLGLKQGASLREHDADGPVSLHVLKGRVEIAVPQHQETLSEGRALVFASSVAHSVLALSDAVVLITIAHPAA
ncbi:MAG TPA: hypothetical protein VFY10_09030 [Dehalococcoidia bacterium]|nr:hypothetical protein [Dehalococcoidia bacterium]